jgi:tol-pal system protein YbgF
MKRRTLPVRLPRPLLALLLPAVLLGSGCAEMREPDVNDQIKQLEERVLELQRKAAVSEVELARLRQQVAELSAHPAGGSAAATPHGGNATAPPPAAVSSPFGTAGERSARLANGAPPPGHRSTGPGSASAPPAGGSPAPVPGHRSTAAAPGGGEGAFSESDIEMPAAPPAPRASAPSRRPALPPAVPPAVAPPLSPLPGSGAPGPSGSPPAGRETPETVPEGKGEPVTPAIQALYDRGYTLYHQKHYVDAETSFQRFLQAEPRSELAANAQYWIGECRYSRGDMRGALAAFRETVTRYPQGNKAADALLKAGMSLESLGDREGARDTYQEVLRRYPGTAVAAVAEERRAKLP